MLMSVAIIPEACSNTFALYKLGWRGVTIDANEELVRKHSALRPRDTAICTVVSDKEEPAVFYDCQDNCVSSLSRGHAARWTKSAVTERKVMTATLSQILRSTGTPGCFDLLCVNVEGHDYEVLASLDLDNFRPRLIVVEMHGFDLRAGAGQDLQALDGA